MSVHVVGRGPGHLARSGAAFYPAATAALDFQLQEYRIGAGSYAIRDLSALTGWSFTRASVKTALNSSGAVVSFASGVPAITDLGFLVEAASTNVSLWSQDFTNAAWSAASGNITVNATAATAPDGTLTANSVTENSATSQHTFHTSSSVSKAASALAYTGSIFVKQSVGSRNLYISIANAAFSSGAELYINPATGAVVTGPTVYGTFTSASAVVTTLGNGWFRVALSATSDTATTIQLQTALASGSTLSYAGNGTSSLLMWGAQLEQASAASSYIATTSAAVTRSADALTLTYSGSPTTATVTYGSGSTATPSAASPLNLGSSSGGAWVGNYVTRVIVQ